MTFKDGYEKFKLHVKENKKIYIAGAAGVAIGVSAVIIFRRSPLVTSKNISLLSFKPTQSNTVITNLTRRGHPGNIVMCRETGEAFASQMRAARATGVNPGNLSRHLNGKLPHVNGLHFAKIREAVA